MTRAVEAFWDDLSNWYVRRSRQRFWEGEPRGLRDAAPRARAVPARHGARSCRSWPRSCGRTSSRAAAARTRRPPCTSRAIPEVDEARIATRPARARWPTCATVVRARAPRARRGQAARAPAARLGGRRAAATPRASQALAALSGEIASELNVKARRPRRPTSTSLVEQQVVPNFRALGPRLGAKVQEVRAALAAGDYELGADGVVRSAARSSARRVRAALARARGLRGGRRTARSSSRSTRA